MLIENGILKAYDGDMKNVVIPEGVRVIGGVVEDGERWSRDGIKSDGVFYFPFNGCSKIKTLTMSNSVIEIGEKAFQGCNNLESVQFSKNLQVIRLSAFLGCEKLKSLTLPASLVRIDTWAFANEIDEITYEGTLWQLENTDTRGAFKNIKKIICKDCTINIDKKKTFYIEEVAYDGTMAELQQNYKDNWILKRTHIIHCKDGSINFGEQ